MRIRQQTPSGDFIFGQSLKNFYINSPIGVGLAVQGALSLFLGEWYLDNTIGVPYVQGVLGKHSQATADQLIQNQVLQVDNVVNIQSYESTLDPETRTYSATMLINTIFGTTEVQMENFLNY